MIVLLRGREWKLTGGPERPPPPPTSKESVLYEYWKTSPCLRFSPGIDRGDVCTDPINTEPPSSPSCRSGVTGRIVCWAAERTLCVVFESLGLSKLLANVSVAFLCQSCRAPSFPCGALYCLPSIPGGRILIGRLLLIYALSCHALLPSRRGGQREYGRPNSTYDDLSSPGSASNLARASDNADQMPNGSAGECTLLSGYCSE